MVGARPLALQGKAEGPGLAQPRKALGAPNSSQPVPTGRLTRRWRQALHGMRTRNSHNLKREVQNGFKEKNLP